MPLTAVFNKKNQNDGVGHATRDTGGALQLPETYDAVNVSPHEGIVPTAATTDFRAGSPKPASVLGTGDNPDRLVNATETA